MAFGDEETQTLLHSVRRFAGEALAADALRDDRYPFVPHNPLPLQRALALGLDGLAPGSGGGAVLLARTLELCAQAEAGHSLCLLVQLLARACLPAASAAESGDTSYAFPVYEDPEEPAPIRARPCPTGYVLDGELSTVSCAPVATCLLVPAHVEPEDRTGLFLVQRATPGVQVGEPLVLLGLRACPAADVRLEGVQLPAAARLDAELGPIVEQLRPGVVALCLGVLRASHARALEYACQRHQGKRRIIEHHMVQELLAYMQSTLDLGALALERACTLLDTTPSALRGGELLSLQELISERVATATSHGVQVLGGNGYMHDYGQEKLMRDAAQLRSVFGSSATRRLRIITRRLAAT